MSVEFEMREMSLDLGFNRNKVEKFLKNQGLRFEGMDLYCAFVDDDENIVAGGGLSGNVIKGIAVDESARSESLTNKIISRLKQIAWERGNIHTKVFTKPENKNIFRSLGYHLVGECDHAILMESDPRGISKYCSRLEALRKDGKNGVIVMNCNPLTKGHEFLIRKAASLVDNLYIIPLTESDSDFSLNERVEMLLSLAQSLKNVIICPSSDYAISYATFPTYFLKETTSASETQIRLDLDIFIRHIVPALGISVRFSGTEPIDPLTRLYYSFMKKILPEHGVDFVSVDRIGIMGKPISASEVRKAVHSLNGRDAVNMVSEYRIPYILGHLAARTLQIELDLTPKPGLVDKNNSGAHNDMDYALMHRSICALLPGYVELAKSGYRKDLPDFAEIKKIGKESENRMFEATHNVNTHKGALFSLGLAIVAIANLLYNKKIISVDSVRDLITELAAGFEQDENSNGGQIRNEFKIPGALDNAKSGYSDVMGIYLPYLSSSESDDFLHHRLLLKIISELTDTNIIHRGGIEALGYAKAEASKVLMNCNEQTLKELDRIFISKNLSPGGAADMFSLTLFIKSII